MGIIVFTFGKFGLYRNSKYPVTPRGSVPPMERMNYRGFHYAAHDGFGK
jgi:hypothetical protein